MLATGTVLQNRYRIVSLLGHGGMAAIYRAWHLNLNMPVAVKEMALQSGLDAQTIAQLHQQFQREAGVLAHMTHPHLVRVIDYFEERGNVYLVMDFVEGESLASRIAEKGAVSEGEVLLWADQLLDALAYCHEQGVIHRDVKPQNVIVRPDGRVVLVDFGLVKLWDPNDSHTRTAMRGMGTPEYSPPEQYGTHIGHTDPRSDLYSLGATLYHALTGQPPLPAGDRMAVPDQFIPPRELNRRVSAHTEAAVLRAMALSHAERFQSAEEMAAALKSGTVAVARPAKRVTSKRVRAGAQSVWWRRSPGCAWALGVASVVLVVGLAAGVIITMEQGGILMPLALATGRPVGTPTHPPTTTAAVEATLPKLTPTETQVAALTPTPLVLATPKDTSTPIPTMTSTPDTSPTPTGTATPTPTPTKTPVPTLSEGERCEYYLYISTYSGSFNPGMWVDGAQPVTLRWTTYADPDEEACMGMIDHYVVSTAGRYICSVSSDFQWVEVGSGENARKELRDYRSCSFTIPTYLVPGEHRLYIIAYGSDNARVSAPYASGGRWRDPAYMHFGVNPR
jgi:serine/threonine-protein kinase